MLFKPMSFRFRKRARILRHLWLNLGKGGMSLSFGVPGLSLNLGKKGVQTSVGLPGSGVSYRSNRRRPL